MLITGFHIEASGVFGTIGRKVRFSVEIAWITHRPQSSTDDDVGQSEGGRVRQLKSKQNAVHAPLTLKPRNQALI